MLSAGLIGGPGLGFGKDKYAAEALQASSPAVYAEVKAGAPSKFLGVFEAVPIDGKKLAEAKEAKEKTVAHKAIIAAVSTAVRRAHAPVSKATPSITSETHTKTASSSAYGVHATRFNAPGSKYSSSLYMKPNASFALIRPETTNSVPTRMRAISTT